MVLNCFAAQESMCRSLRQIRPSEPHSCPANPMECWDPRLLRKNRVQSPTLPQALARSLAYYASAGLGVLAPRGWYCFELYGSSGLTLIVTPERHDARDLFRPDSHLTGPVIQLSFFFGDTSGRFLVAQVAARLFPVKKSFVQQIIDEGIEPPSDFPSGPYPATSSSVGARPKSSSRHHRKRWHGHGEK